MRSKISHISSKIVERNFSILKRYIENKKYSHVKTLLQDFEVSLSKLICYASFYDSINSYMQIIRYVYLYGTTGQRLHVETILLIIILRLKDKFVNFADDLIPVIILFQNDPCKYIKNFYDKFFSKIFENKTSYIYQKYSKPIEKQLLYLIEVLNNENMTYNSWTRVCDNALMLSTKYIVATKKLDFVEKIPYFEWIKKLNLFADRRNFFIFALMILKMGYQIFRDPQEIFNLIASESAIEGQKALISLIIENVKRSFIQKTEIQEVFLKSIEKYSKPSKIGLDLLLKELKDEEFVHKCLERAIHCENQVIGIIYLSFFISVFELQEDDLEKLLDRAISNETSVLSTFPVTYYASYPQFDEKIRKLKDIQCLNYLMKIGEERAEKWIRSKEILSATLLMKLLQTYSKDYVRKIYPNLASIKVRINQKDDFQSFLEKYINDDDIDYLIKNYNDYVPNVFYSWKGDIKLFKRPEFEQNIKVYLEQKLENSEKILLLYPDAKPLIQEIVMKYIMNSKPVDKFSLSLVNLSDDILINLIKTGSAKKLNKDNVIIPLLLDLYPKYISKIDVADTISFFMSLKLDPNQLKVTPDDDIAYCFNFWNAYNFNYLENINLLYMIDKLIIKLNPWAPVMIYLRKDVDWSFMPASFLIKIRHNITSMYTAIDQGLDLAANFVKSAQILSFKDYPKVSATYRIFTKEVPPDDLESDPWIDLIRMEWKKMQPEVFEYNPDNDEIYYLRRLIVYLEEHTGYIVDFDLIMKLATDHFSFFLVLKVLSLSYDQIKDIYMTRQWVETKALDYSPIPRPIKECMPENVSKWLIC